jgi:uncharacterized protein YjbI with pentapeptide repeats
VANQTHLSELKKLSDQTRGYKDWNQWRRENPTVTPNLSKADLSGLNLGLFDLRGSNLSSALLRSTQLFSAQLDNADLSNANLSKANLSSAQLTNCNLDKANLSKADLREANLRKANLVAANLREANLSKATLSFANLTHVSMIKADLTLAIMRATNLQDADLSAVQALSTDFEGALLTGACLQDWNLNNKTTLDNVQCEYIYLEKVFGGRFSRRYPNDRTFSLGEFTKRFQKVSDAIEFFLPNGIGELSMSLQSLRQLHPDKVFAVQAIESKERDAVLVRLEALPVKSQESAEKFYQEQIQLAEASYGLQAVAPNLYRQYMSEQHRTDKRLTQGQRQRLEMELKDLQDDWNRRTERLRYLRRDLAIESGASIRFQLQQQIEDAEEEMKSLNTKLAEIEQTLDYQEIFSTLD